MLSVGEVLGDGVLNDSMVIIVEGVREIFLVNGNYV